MTDRQIERINTFFVKSFNHILLWEERYLNDRGLQDLSVKEIHVIASVVRLEELGQNSMSQIAADICLSTSALATAVTTLVNKGALERGSDPNDRRVVLVRATEKGLTANEIHEEFHQKMVASISETMNESELERLTGSLEILADFFRNAAQKS